MKKPERLESWDEAKLLLSFSDGPLLVNTEENHYKFWHYDRNEQIAYWGRIGNKVRTTDYSGSPWKISGIIRDKLVKGYRRIDDTE